MIPGSISVSCFVSLGPLTTYVLSGRRQLAELAHARDDGRFARVGDEADRGRAARALGAVARGALGDRLERGAQPRARGGRRDALAEEHERGLLVQVEAAATARLGEVLDAPLLPWERVAARRVGEQRARRAAAHERALARRGGGDAFPWKEAVGGRASWQLFAEGRFCELLSEDCENPSP